MSFPIKTKLDRIDQTISRLIKSVYLPLVDLETELWVTAEPTSFADRTSGQYSKPKAGDVWGKLWDCGWFHFTGTVPKEAAGKSVVLLIDLGGEGLIVDRCGAPVQGLTSISSGFDFSLGKPGKRVFPFANPAAGGEDVDLWVDAGLNDLFGSLRNGGKLDEARIAVRRENAQALCFDFEVLRELLDQLPPKSARYAAVLQALYEASLVLGHGAEDPAVDAARLRLSSELAKRGGDPSLTISAIGHAHIDLAWLWPLRETYRKGARTFATALRMMERYPDYVFGASQPQLYQWMKDQYPSLFEEIKIRVAEGRWEVQGAMWVEPDANIPSGESLVRQLLYGKRFYRREFGIDVTNLWLPDVFGYSGSIPQILRKSGVDTFLTQKLSWSLFNQHPHHTFHWEGIDGSSVLVHMPPEATYNSSAAPRAIAGIENDFLDKDVSSHSILLFGIGDGGGGPGEEHLERLAREKNLAGLSPVVQETSDRFFAKIKDGSDKYARWRGELYLERHQGTLTSQARNKLYNRKLEFGLRELELAAVRAMRAGAAYPSAEIERIWKEVLLLQFHDILPGSSITRVYDESLTRYAALSEEVAALTVGADRAITGQGTETWVVNSLSWDRTEWLKSGETWRQVRVPALGYAAVSSISDAYEAVTVTEQVLENEAFRLSFSPRGDLVSIYDKESQREVIRPGEVGNRLALYEDNGDAWDFKTDYSSVPPIGLELVSSEIIADGPKATVIQNRRVGNSTLTQEISLTSGSKRIDFVTHVDWRERQQMLRVMFPIGVHADTARCEIQFGNIERATHANTSWDWAKDEVCAQKWIDISEPGYGVALLNDCKYGHTVRDGILNLNLLRSAVYPDPVADHAQQSFTYALYPHVGDYVSANVVREAYQLNVPLRLIGSASSELPPSLIQIDSDDIIIEALKKAEDSDDLIVRLYEIHGKTVRTRARFGFPVESLAETNLMEEDLRPIEIIDNAFELALKPFEIISLRVTSG